MTNKNKLLNLAREFAKQHHKQDTDALLALLFQDNVHCWGTGVDEERRNIHEIREQFIRDFSEIDTAQLTPEHLQVFSTTSSGVIFGNWLIRYTLKGSNISHKLLLRSTFYAEEVNGNWAIRHMHWSVPFSLQPEDRSFPPEEEECL